MEPNMVQAEAEGMLNLTPRERAEGLYQRIRKAKEPEGGWPPNVIDDLEELIIDADRARKHKKERDEARKLADELGNHLSDWVNDEDYGSMFFAEKAVVTAWEQRSWAREEAEQR